jgi:hypothetical protein
VTGSPATAVVRMTAAPAGTAADANAAGAPLAASTSMVAAAIAGAVLLSLVRNLIEASSLEAQVRYAWATREVREDSPAMPRI